MTPAATAELGSPEPKTGPRVGYLVYRVERRLRAGLDEELRLIGLSPQETVEVVRAALRSFAHSLEVTNPSHRPRPLGGRAGTQ